MTATTTAWPPAAEDHRSLVDDPVALQVIWRRLITIADEAAATLRRTSFSPIVRESNDFACVLCDAAGNVIAENTIGIPSFNCILSTTLAHFLKWRPAELWKPGDVGITNDPWLVSGHLPDVAILAPVFLDQRLVGWTGSIAHMSDIGGSVFSADTRSVFEEGVRVPPTLFLSQGVLNETLANLLNANVRLPEQVTGDLQAQVAAAHTAGQALVHLMRTEGIDDLSEISEAIRQRSELAMRRAIAAIPDGHYEATVETDGTGEEPVWVKVAVDKRGEELFIDYAGTSPEVGSAHNCVFNYTHAYTCYPLKCMLDPATARNEGSYAMIHVKAPEGSILNPRFPAPVNTRQTVGHCLAAAVFQALAPALGQRVIAESGSAPTLRVILSGTREDESRFNVLFFINGGMGARGSKDGLSATCFPSNVISGSMEVVEATAPVRIHRKELAVDSGGAGQFRGGLGQDVEIELISSRPSILSLVVDRKQNPALGVLGGGTGAASKVLLNGEPGRMPMKGKSRLQPGDRLRVIYPGGGGFGPPAQRDRGLVAADLEAGLMSPAAAKEVYGL